MFGYVGPNWKELSPDQQNRYSGVYCGICRRIRYQSGQLSRLSLRYDMAFLALLLMSLYEPEESSGPSACILHPIKKRPWVDNTYIRYAADMNVALAYYKCMDDWQDDGSYTARFMAGTLGDRYPQIRERYPRQCDAIARCIAELSQLERQGCTDPDAPANVFGSLMGELLVYQEDLWATTLRQMGMALGRFVYLMDAAEDHREDARRGRYNPFNAMGCEADPTRWEEYLVLAMGSCTLAYERLPLVQDKALLDNILYSGVWITGRGKKNGRKS